MERKKGNTMRSLMKCSKWAIPAGALLLGLTASAVPIYLDPPGQVTGSPSSPADELNRLKSAIITYNTATPANLPAAVAIDLTPLGVDKSADGGQFKTPSGPTSITLDFSLEHETYLMLKWGDIDEFFFVGNETGSVTFTSDVHPITPNGPNLHAFLGLSHYDLFDPKRLGRSVPDGGSSLVLLGLGLTGVSVMARRRGNA